VKKKSILALSISAIVAGGAFAAFATHQPSAAPAPRAQVASTTVSVVSPQATPFARAVAATGSVSARDELVVGSDASGVRLMEVLVDVGSSVQKGQLLARADDRQLLAQLAQQDAAIKQAQAENVQAQANLERAGLLTDLYSAETVETRRTTAATAQAKLDLALAQRDELRIKLAYTRVLAPAAGVISRKSATVGAVVQQGGELFRLIRDGELEWRAELPHHSLVRIQAGAPVRLFDDGKPVAAKVRLVAPTIDTATRNGTVYVTLPAGTRFKAGGHARGEILLELADALSLPESAVMTKDGYSFVYTVADDGVARLTKVETGARQQGLVEVSGGLAARSRVVGAGAGFVKDGDLVRVSKGDNS
jgi:HlyD family secretion protein